MKALTLTQPYGSLVVMGAKGNETRSWMTQHRGRIAIHAAKGFPLWAKLACAREPFASALHVTNAPDCWDALPIGAVIGEADLVSIVKITSTSEYLLPQFQMLPEFHFGDYTPGRYVWRLANAVQYIEPIPCRGALSLWEWEKPQGVQYRVAA